MHMYKDKLGEYGTTFLGPDRRISLLSSHMHICMLASRSSCAQQEQMVSAAGFREA